APVAKGKRVVRIESDRLVVIGNRSIVLAFFRISDAPVAKGKRVVRIESDRLVIIGNRSIVIAFVRISDASVVEGIRVGIESDRLAEQGDSPVIVTIVRSCSALARQSHALGEPTDCNCFCFLLALADNNHRSLFAYWRSGNERPQVARVLDVLAVER